MNVKRADLLLKIIATANGKRLTPVQLQKVAFLLGEKRRVAMPEDYFSFRKYDYGPFSAEVYADAEQLERDGLIAISINPRGGWREYSATAEGIEADFENIPEGVASFIDDTVQWAMQLSFQQLVRAVYEEFPQYRENSVFQG